MKNILITGANSYIGCSFEKYVLQWPELYHVDTLDMLNPDWEEYSFSNYDAVLHVAGIAHIKETPKNRYLYYDVNRDLAVKVAKKAKNAGISQFILLSSMSVYGINKGVITKQTSAAPTNAYGESKYLADVELEKENNDGFKVAILRPPMVYGKNCKGNYQKLRSIVLKSPVFPDLPNKRSMVFIGNLCEFIKRTIDLQLSGIFFPQNSEYVKTSKMVELIAKENGKKIKLLRFFNPLIKILPFDVLNKVFGTLIYERVDTVEKYSFEESIRLSEKL